MFQTKSRGRPCPDEEPMPKPKQRAKATPKPADYVSVKTLDAVVDALGIAIGGVVADERKQTRAVVESLQRHVAELERTQVKFAGVWRAGTSYDKGALVSHQGSGWIATRQYPGKPGEPRSGWVLFCKRGRDAR